MSVNQFEEAKEATKNENTAMSGLWETWLCGIR